ncbi:hypothetical protein [Mycoplasma sp. Mirounga ES2805-ORL]|uniref:hypothetical protein n=1 Tax=Mycoplasma sp. Mirounga ES2805-ORL TaxID=754514 RepID=UPI00197B39E9|nr:hypothetical protein [Mycoplasma sp. Mirounga ES2805-ORL]QSF13887.1 hypothetical protein JXZ90_01125 [Mycoplasma sp. Mirounga ES2805-ORL]
MKKINVKFKTIFWLFLTIAASIVTILSIIVIKNANLIIRTNELVEIEQRLVSQAYREKEYAIGLIFFSSFVLLIGTYIIYAGIKSWHYSAII